MDTKNMKTAHEVVNHYDEKQLIQILKSYGELKEAKKTAYHIIKSREVKKINTTTELKEVIENIFPKKILNKRLSQVFQAIRIEINDELNSLKTLLTNSTDILKKGGRVSIISYHSLEDRLVKNFFNAGNFEGKIKTDIMGNILRPLRPIGKLIIPSESEIENNSRARSAKLRIAEKL